MVIGLIKDNILEISVENSEKCDIQQLDNSISNLATQIRNSSTITDMKCYMKHLLLITFLIKTLITLIQKNKTPTVTLNPTHSPDRQFLNIFQQNIGGLRNKTNELLCHLHHNLPQIICVTECHLNQMELNLIHTESYLLGSYYCRKHIERWYLHLLL